MKARLVHPLMMAPGHPDFVPGKKGQWLPVGTILEHPQAAGLVEQGVARCADAECEQAVSITEEQWQAAFKAYGPFSRGIAMEDYDAYHSGEMVGYDPETGEPIPGPNAPELEDD